MTAPWTAWICCSLSRRESEEQTLGYSMPHGACKQRVFRLVAKRAGCKRRWLDLIWEAMQEKSAMKRLAVTGGFTAKRDICPNARTKRLEVAAIPGIERRRRFAGSNVRLVNSNICCGWARALTCAFPPEMPAGAPGPVGPCNYRSAGGAGAGRTCGAGGKRNAKLLAQAAGQISDHAQAIGHRRRDFAAAEGEL